MAKYPLLMLIGIRERRYDSELLKQKQLSDKLDLIKKEIKEKQEDLIKYKEWKNAEIDRRYESIIGEVKTQKELEAFNKGIADLDIEEMEKSSYIEKLKKDMAQCEKDFRLAQEAVSKALKAVEKLKRHQEIWIYEQKQYAEKLTDSELEDFKVKKIDYV